MVALIFMYVETLGKPLAAYAGKPTDTKNKVCAFAEMYLPELWKAFELFPNRADILGNYYRNGLAHEMFMKDNAGIHEGGTDYVLKNISGIPYSINIDLSYLFKGGATQEAKETFLEILIIVKGNGSVFR